MGLSGSDNVRVHVVSVPDKDALVVNLYRDVAGDTFVYEGDHGGLWLKITPGEVHRPSYTFPGAVARKVIHAFDAHGQWSASLAESAAELYSTRLRASSAEEALAESRELVSKLLDVVDNLSVAARSMA